MTESPSKDLITRQQAADRAGLSIQTIDRYLAQGLLTKYKAGPTKRFVRVDSAELDELLRPEPETG